MFRTDNQQELVDQFAVMMKDQRGDFTAGYAVQMATDMLNLIPKRKQKEFLTCLRSFNNCQMVTVKNCLTGKEVQIPRAIRVLATIPVANCFTQCKVD